MSILEEGAVAAFLGLHENHRKGPRPVAVFDCDGTVIQGDIGEAMFYRQIEHFHFRRSPAVLWPDYPRAGELARLYDELAPLDPAARAGNPGFGAFAGLLLSRYFDQIEQGAVAKACADIVRLFAGYTPAEVRELARETFEEEISSPMGTRRLGTRTLPRGARYIRESVDLIGALTLRGFDVWAVSGSNRWSVEPVFRRFGVPPERVIGIDLEVRDGILTERTAGPVPIRAGKIDALRQSTPAVPLLCASDSRNDIPLLLYSSGLKVRINSRKRDTADFFRSAGIVPDESWVLVESPHIME
ncbi:MAG TPA: haloacid dehalogenase-like hydrolase [Bacteroidota bacterium]|nr:haloacid dehalogenase-like hydrolase [Bacteroidota bacterium]